MSDNRRNNRRENKSGGGGAKRSSKSADENIGADGTAANKKKYGSLESLPILRWGVSNSFSNFKRALVTVAGREYGRLAEFLTTDEYYVEPAVEFDREDLDEDVDEFGFNRKAIQKKMDLRQEREDRMRADRPKLYAMILGNVSKKRTAPVSKILKSPVFFAQHNTEICQKIVNFV